MMASILVQTWPITGATWRVVCSIVDNIDHSRHRTPLDPKLTSCPSWTARRQAAAEKRREACAFFQVNKTPQRPNWEDTFLLILGWMDHPAAMFKRGSKNTLMTEAAMVRQAETRGFPFTARTLLNLRLQRCSFLYQQIFSYLLFSNWHLTSFTTQHCMETFSRCSDIYRSPSVFQTRLA